MAWLFDWQEFHENDSRPIILRYRPSLKFFMCAMLAYLVVLDIPAGIKHLDVVRGDTD